MSQENVEIVRAVLDAFMAGLQRGEFTGAGDTGLMADDYEWVAPPEVAGLGVYRGREGFLDFMRTWTEDFEDWSVRLDRLIDAPGDRVVAFMQQSGTGKGSGVAVDLDYGAVVDLHDGQVVRISLYMTRQQALKAAGLSE
jgi:ketosteroid isomerase-like protein